MSAKATDIQAKIDKNRETISKKKTLIEKRQKQAAKITAKICEFETIKKAGLTIQGTELESLKAFSDAVHNIYRDACRADESFAGNEIYWLNCDLFDCIESISNAFDAIEEKERIIANQIQQLAKINEKNDSISSLPEVFVAFRDGVAEMWDAWDQMRRASVQEDQDYLAEINQRLYHMPRDEAYREALDSYYKISEEIRSKYSGAEWSELPSKTDEQIHAENIDSANILILNLCNRVQAITGDITDASGLKLSRGNQGCTVINGIVHGVNGTAKVQSVGAGGYNIQRFHIRTLVHAMKGVA